MPPPRPRVFIARVIPETGLRRIQERCETDVWPEDRPAPRDELLRRVAGCDGILTLLTDRVDEELLHAAGPGLRVVSNLAVGYDNVDVAACARRGIAVGNTPGALTETTADLAWALMLAARRRLAEGDRYVRAGEWQTWGPNLFLGSDVHGATLGIVGFGRIGQAVAHRAVGFGMTVLYASRTRAPESVETALAARFVELDELLSESDIVSLHCALTPQTRGLIGRRALERMKPSATLVNTARGPVVDQAALYVALRDGVIAAAGLDVTDPEPISPDDPLLSLENCTVVPHIASATHATRARMAEMAADNLLAGVSGQPLPTPVQIA
ncbi:MAG: D-glycerate dehydrogenase [Chloroflexota bacterium]|nr:D-glycerate dehydrogenase [Chloroflexota bacterium]